MSLSFAESVLGIRGHRAIERGKRVHEKIRAIIFDFNGVIAGDEETQDRGSAAVLATQRLGDRFSGPIVGQCRLALPYLEERQTFSETSSGENALVHSEG